MLDLVPRNRVAAPGRHVASPSDVMQLTSLAQGGGYGENPSDRTHGVWGGSFLVQEDVDHSKPPFRVLPIRPIAKAQSTPLAVYGKSARVYRCSFEFLA